MDDRIGPAATRQKELNIPEDWVCVWVVLIVRTHLQGPQRVRHALRSVLHRLTGYLPCDQSPATATIELKPIAAARSAIQRRRRLISTGCSSAPNFPEYASRYPEQAPPTNGGPRWTGTTYLRGARPQAIY